MEEALNPVVAPTPGSVTGEREVRVLRASTNPVPCAGAAGPPESLLYDERPPSDVSEEEWTLIDAQYGTIEAPYVATSIDPDCLYAGDGPEAADVAQGALGDCALMAVLINVVGKDPGVIEGMLRIGNGAAEVDFYRFDSTAGAWVPATITVPTTFLRQSGNAGKLLAARVRCGVTPTKGSWYAEMEGSALTINADYSYPAALWVPIIEKAYAAYIEQFGQYGGGPKAAGSENRTTDDTGARLSGYEIMNEGGLERFLYRLFYGGAVRNEAVKAVQYSPDTTLVSSNQRALWALVRAHENVGTDAHASVSLSEDAALERLDAELEHALDAQWMVRYGDAFSDMLQRLRSAIEAWRGAADKKSAMEKVASLAVHATKPGNWPVLASDREDGGFHGLQELLLIVSHVGQDHGGSQRHTYAGHAYSVLDTTFLDDAGQPLALTATNYRGLLDRIDPIRSSVALRNPHGANEPNPDGEKRTEDGEFTLTLEQFFRAFDTLEFAAVEAS